MRLQSYINLSYVLPTKQKVLLRQGVNIVEDDLFAVLKEQKYYQALVNNGSVLELDKYESAPAANAKQEPTPDFPDLYKGKKKDKGGFTPPPKG